MDDLKVKLTLDNEKVHLTGVSELYSGQTVPFDYAPPLGDGAGFAGLEMLLMSLGGCVSTAVVALIRRFGRSIEAYRLEARGVRRENPLSLQSAELVAYIKSPDLTEEEMIKTCQMAEKISPVWLAVKNNVEVSLTYKINAD